MDSKKLQQINIEPQTLKELQDEIHPKIIEILKKSCFIQMLESYINLSEDSNDEQLKNHIEIDENLSLQIKICWMDEDGNRVCELVKL
ncbi:MAG: hypothetical protein V7K89_07335 [Nostoc sp.]|uniref:hypothetical protein n=1 Tax=Nostoc sp. TaxID=1180 RepID=UPI002FFBFB9F